MDLISTAAAALILLGAIVALANWWSLYSSLRTKKFCSPVPLAGAMFLGGGMFLLPAARPYCWSALLIDYGTLSLLLAAPRIAGEIWSTSRRNLVSEYLGHSGNRTVRLCLFKKQIFTLRLAIQRKEGEPGLVSYGSTGTWQIHEGRLTLQSQNEVAVFDVLAGARNHAILQATGFPTWESNPELTLAGIQLMKLTATK